MTFIAGYIYSGYAAIIADSAETIEIPLPHQGFFEQISVSTFGERVQLGDNDIKLESAQKLYNIRDKAVMTFAGDVREGNDAVDQLRYLLLKEITVSQAIKELIGVSGFNRNQFIIAYFEENKPMLFYFDNYTNYHFIDHPQAIAVAGLDADGFYPLFQQAVKRCAGKQVSNEEMMMHVLGTVQAFSVQELTLQQGVGGYFNGVSISQKGIEWASDSMFYLFSAKHYSVGVHHPVFRFNRDNATFVMTNDSSRVFVNQIEAHIANELVERWGSEVNDLARRHSVRYFVFIPYDRRNVVIIDKDKKAGLTIEKIDENYGMVLSDFIIAAASHDSERHNFHSFTNFFPDESDNYILSGK